MRAEGITPADKFSRGIHPMGIDQMNSRVADVAQRKDNSYALTDKGTEALFVRRCIAGLEAIAADPEVKLAGDVTTFLGRKGHIVATAEPGKFAITPKGLECLADIAENP